MAGKGIITYRASDDAIRRQPTLRHTSSNQAGEPALIGVDWGTSSCRAYLIDRTGQVLDRVVDGKGILQIAHGAFAEALEDMIGSWRRPGLPTVLSGMIGSRQGWIEVPYVQTPARFDQIVAGMVRCPDDPEIHLVPGLAQDLPGQAPDVMRGEETQILGAHDNAVGRHLLVMPGTHSKWVLVEEGEIVWFATYMTGEVFALLKDHSILGRLMDNDGKDHQSAFIQGLNARHDIKGGVLQQLFSVRTLGLFERLSDVELPAYLSGLLIGHEIEEAMTNFDEAATSMPIVIIGTSSLARRYADALAHAGFEPLAAGEDVAARGHYDLARAARLLPDLDGEMM
jgi:2-dehydro-3-deoxygalactonokinase